MGNLSIRRVAGSVLVSVTASVALAASASADLVPGQYVSASKYQCGGQEYITGTYGVGSFGLQEKSYIYRNCGTTTRYRKADVIADRDGNCYGISAGKARVLEVKYAVPRQVYRGSLVC